MSSARMGGHQTRRCASSGQMQTNDDIQMRRKTDQAQPRLLMLHCNFVVGSQGWGTTRLLKATSDVPCSATSEVQTCKSPRGKVRIREQYPYSHLMVPYTSSTTKLCKFIELRNFLVDSNTPGARGTLPCSNCNMLMAVRAMG
eukprot:scaffold443_cov177-Amphora_coffeaeformis.AAC.7